MKETKEVKQKGIVMQCTEVYYRSLIIHPISADSLTVTDVTAARTLFVRDCPVRATFADWGEFVLMIGGHKKGAYEAKGREGIDYLRVW